MSGSGTLQAEGPGTTKGSPPGAEATPSHESKCTGALVTLVEKIAAKSHLVAEDPKDPCHQATAVAKAGGRPSGVHTFSWNVGGQVRGFPEGWSVADELHAAGRGDAL